MCKHENWKVIIGCDKMTKCGLENANAHNHKDGVRQNISAWCSDCGALKINREWVLPGDY